MRRLLPALMIGLGTLLMLATGSGLYFRDQIGQSVTVRLPKHIADLTLNTELAGAEALKEFEMLHGKAFGLTSGSVGIYGQGQAKLWIAGAPFGFMAANLVGAMRDRIAEGRSPFMAIGQMQDGGRAVYELEGMGQKHFYFQSNNLVVWLAADPAVADVAIHQALEAYP